MDDFKWFQYLILAQISVFSLYPNLDPMVRCSTFQRPKDHFKEFRVKYVGVIICSRQISTKHVGSLFWGTRFLDTKPNLGVVTDSYNSNLLYPEPRWRKKDDMLWIDETFLATSKTNIGPTSKQSHHVFWIFLAGHGVHHQKFLWQWPLLLDTQENLCLLRAPASHLLRSLVYPAKITLGPSAIWKTGVLLPWDSPFWITSKMDMDRPFL